jgi:DNA mismatch repair protein MutL
MPIQILAPEVVSQIAAGEVVERPASVVKELVENSLDAGASQISIEVKGGGVTLIRVIDNGVGIPSVNVELAFHRHATSKITSLSDLENSLSLGFRGEALPSIAAVAQVDFLARGKEEIAGTYISLRDGKIVERGNRACPEGTTAVVRGLFRNVPARLKFLKSSATENSHIVDFVNQYSLAFPEVRFSLIIDGRRVLHTSGSGRLKDVLVEVYGLQTAQAMLEIKAKDSEDRLIPMISGYISPPSVSRASRGYLSFFINQRWIQSRLLARAVEKAYEGMLMTGRYPIAIINLSLSPQGVDVNVHPSKREVRFRQDQAIFSAVYEAVHRKLTEQSPVPQMKPQQVLTPSLEQLQISPMPRPSEVSVSPPSPPTLETASSEVPILRVLGQLASTYIIAEGPDGLYLIDQHSAHERVMFENILAQRAQRKVEIQGLLEPLTIELNTRQTEQLNSRGEALTQFGIEIEPFGDRTYLIRAIPAMLKVEKVAEVVREILDSLEEDAAAKWDERIALSIACHSALRAGQNLGQEEIKELVRQLEQTTSPRTCPHGRPTMIHLSALQLAREFGRS